MIRRAFLRRMAFAALATVLVDVPLPSRRYEDLVSDELVALADALRRWNGATITTTEAFRRLSEGIRRDSHLMLDYLGVVRRPEESPIESVRRTVTEIA